MFNPDSLLTPDSDRMKLTVRITADGRREWLDHRGTIALVYYERGYWHARPDSFTPATRHLDEASALNTALNDMLFAIRSNARGF